MAFFPKCATEGGTPLKIFIVRGGIIREPKVPLEDFENFFQRMSHPFQGLPTKIMITGSTIIIRIIIEVSVFVVLPRLLLNLVAKTCCQGCY